LIENPDQAILDSHKAAITSDSAILDKVEHWVNLGAYLIAKYFQGACLIDFSGALNNPEVC
jgi:hypothetical protein